MNGRAPDVLPLAGRVALVTGSSRGIGAETARLLAAAGARVVVTYREKRRRAEAVVSDIRAAGGEALPAAADLTDPVAVADLVATVADRWGRIDVLILNASGGMEAGAPPDYALRLNRDAQLSLVDAALPLMPAGSRVVFLTSHSAHFLGDVMDVYRPVAESKHAGEQLLRRRIPDLARRGVRVIVVSGDLVEGTATMMLMERAEPGVVATRLSQAGRLPTIHDMAEAVVAATVADHASGYTAYVGSTAYVGISAYQDGRGGRGPQAAGAQSPESSERAQ